MKYTTVLIFRIIGIGLMLLLGSGSGLWAYSANILYVHSHATTYDANPSVALGHTTGAAGQSALNPYRRNSHIPFCPTTCPQPQTNEESDETQNTEEPEQSPTDDQNPKSCNANVASISQWDLGNRHIQARCIHAIFVCNRGLQYYARYLRFHFLRL